jgi:hypothetical protein
MKTLITMEVEREEVLKELIPLLNRLKVPYSASQKVDSDFEEATALDYETFMNELNALGGKKGVKSSFGDAAEYQIEVRKDRIMPFRD